MNDFEDGEQMFGITRTEFDLRVTSAVEKLLLRYGCIDKDKAPEVKWLTMNELCERLDISRQTVYNWRRDKRIQQFLDPYIKKNGKRLLFAIDSIKKEVLANRLLLSTTKGDHLRTAVAPAPKREESEDDFIRGRRRLIQKAQGNEDENEF